MLSREGFVSELVSRRVILCIVDKNRLNDFPFEARKLEHLQRASHSPLRHAVSVRDRTVLMRSKLGCC